MSLTLPEILALFQKLEPAVAAVVTAINPSVGATVGVANGVLVGAEGLYAQLTALYEAKGLVDPAVWNAQVAAFNAGAADVAAAEAGK